LPHLRGERTVIPMKPIAAVVLTIGLVFLFAATASAQAKDPFRPVPGAESTGAGGGGGTTTVGGLGTGSVTGSQPGGGLPRTGQDYSIPVLAAAALIAAGASMRLAGRALAP